VEVNIVNEVATLQRLSVGQLRQRFAELFGEATAASNRTWLIKRIAWRMQALAEGELSLNAPADAPTNWPATPTSASTRPNRKRPRHRLLRSLQAWRRPSISACRRRAPF
jgi:hypothetical protein